MGSNGVGADDSRNTAEKHEGGTFPLMPSVPVRRTDNHIVETISIDITRAGNACTEYGRLECWRIWLVRFQNGIRCPGKQRIDHQRIG